MVSNLIYTSRLCNLLPAYATQRLGVPWGIRYNRGVGRCTPLPPLLIERQSTTPEDGFVRSRGWLTAFISNTTMDFVEDGASLGSRQLDMGNPRLGWANG